MKKPYLIAIVMTGTIVLWMVSGLLKTSTTPELEEDTTKDQPLMLVKTEIQQAKTMQLSITAQAHVEPNRSIMLRSNIEGRVAAILVKPGEWVKSGDTILRLAIDDRKIILAREKAQLSSQQQAYKRAVALSKTKFQSQSVFEETYANLKSAEANVAEIEFEIKKLTIKAPFSGVLDTQMVEQGSYIAANGEVGRFVENDPLIVVVQIAQKNIQQIKLGTNATVTFATDESREGIIKYISPLAKESTRTFKVEISIENADRSIPAGISAVANIPTTMATGHFISPALISLNTVGAMGVKTVDKNNIVVFHPISIIQSTTQGAWVKGLPKSANIITVGQGFVSAGEKINVERVTSENEKSVIEAVGTNNKKVAHE